MKKILFLLTMLTFFISVNCGDKNAKFKTISAPEFLDLIGGSQNVILIDVRTPEEFVEGHIPAANNLDVKSQDFKNRLLENYKDKKKVYALYCRSGHRSKLAAQILVDNGYTEVYEMEGGFNAWKEKDFPIEK
ncbi:MAG: rhodanese-like domain-containing protein [Bacteroidales bacterium]|nr:rhodanese-like domain-containing protein [Bacteroidales bacterium]